VSSLESRGLRVLTRRGFLLVGTLGAAACRKRGAPGTFRALLNDVRDEYSLPAVAAVATRADRILACDAVGLRRLGSPEHVDPDSRFHLGSLTKAITATMVATLVEERRLRWDSTPLEVFPEWKKAQSIDRAYRQVGIDALFRHRAGLPPFRNWPRAPEFSGFPEGATREHVARWILRRPPVNDPGSASAYSNAGPAIASAMAERVTGRPWEALVEERVFEPLGIRGGFGPPASEDATQPWGHEPSTFGLEPCDPRSRGPLPGFFRPSGDVHMSMAGYARFLQVHLSGLAGRDSLLKAATVGHLHAPVDSYGLGWGVGPLNGLMSSGHVGSDGTFMALVGIWHTKDLAIAVAANAGTDRAEKACQAASDSIFRMFA
jgi:CubicO group peptidase (beta-lactamase class C family)